jgi:ABC-type bacteriocin/lantibiotic exporter with double-glycine peptidase domain
VLADDYLFTGTIAGNIHLADPAASDDEIEALLAAIPRKNGVSWAPSRPRWH